ncbi:MAG: NAD(P)/FAD-dependent oxidoreductase [Candidatus Kerfeldbacteria bacterium]|jgi:FAD-dependent oxidoreductase domain-containing protein 1
MTEKFKTPDPTMPTSADVVVIGGGTIGALVTLQLQEAGLKTVCVEAHSTNFGSSSRSAAAARQQFGMEANITMQLYSVDFFANWKKTLGGTTPPMHQVGYHFMFDNNFTDNGSTRVDSKAVVAAKLKRVEKQRALGLNDVELLMPDEVAERFPYVDTSELACSTFCQTDGYCYPNVITNDGFDRAKSLGATLLQNTLVSGFKTDSNGNITAVVTNKGEIPCQYVVNAAGVWASRVGDMVGTELPISPVRRYLYFMGPNLGQLDYDSFAKKNNLPMPMSDMPFTVTPNGAYCRADGKQFMLGWDRRPSEDVIYDLPSLVDHDASIQAQDIIQDGFRTNDDPSYAEEMCMEVSERLPFVLDHCGFASATSGFYGITADHSPIISFDSNAKNLIHCTGFSGHGIMQGPAAGKLVIDLITGNTSPIVDPFVYSLGGLLSHLNGDTKNARPAEHMVI